MPGISIDHLLEVAEANPSPQHLRAIAGAVGIALARRDTASLGRVVEVLAGTAGSDDRSYARALRDLLGAFLTEETETSRRRVAVDRARREPYAAILAAIANGTTTPTEIAAAIDRSPGNVSRALDLLVEDGLVEQYSGSDRRERPHRLSILGRQALDAPAPTASRTAVNVSKAARRSKRVVTLEADSVIAFIDGLREALGETSAREPSPNDVDDDVDVDVDVEDTRNEVHGSFGEAGPSGLADGIGAGEASRGAGRRGR